MKFRNVLTCAAIALAAAGAPVAAQTGQENRDADALAADMRLLASNPVDLEALITAGEITLRMGDLTAATAFFGRAEKIDPVNPRTQAGMGSLLVRAQRPGEALRRFAAAEARGLEPARYAADRGLAYDLVGEQERAQRDYRLALKDGPDDEVSRRYALSLGISGRHDEAVRQLEPLIKRNDRAAWRDRAFILAMKGDAAGAQKIANSMMSPGVGAGLAPFFQRLPLLSPVDRAFAVTFGEIRATPERLADARLAPALPRLGPDPDAPRSVQVAAAEPVRSKDDRRGGKRKGRGKEVAPAAVAPTPTRVAAAEPIPPAYVAPGPETAASRAGSEKPVSSGTEPRTLAAVTPSASGRRSSPSVAKVQEKPAPPAQAPAPAPSPAPAPAPVVVAAREPVRSAPTETRAESVAPVAVPPPPASAAPADAAPPRAGVADQPSPREAGVSRPSAVAHVSEDSVLARIIAGINVPASELGVAPMPERAAPPPPPAPVTDVPRPSARPVAAPKPAAPRPAAAKAARDEPEADARPKVRGKAVADQKDEADDCAPATIRGKAPAARGKSVTGKAPTRCEKPETPAKAKTAARDADADCPADSKAKGRATVAKGKAATRCKAPDKDEAATRGDPARIWVQVAGGANEATLEKAWSGVKAKAPDLFRGRQGWKTPLRATNRVLTGPFKTADEAQAFVNRMSGAGLSGFVFTSAKGQKVEALGGK